MKEYNFPLPGIEDEKIVYFTRRHWASMLFNFFIMLAMAILPILLFFMILITADISMSVLSINIVTIVAAVYYLVLASYILTQWIDYYYDILIITQKEIIDINQDGIFNREINEISIINVQDVTSHVKGFFPTLFAYGDVIAESAGERTQTYIINNIPNPMEVASRILEIHDQLKTCKGEEPGEPFAIKMTYVGAGLGTEKPDSSLKPANAPFLKDLKENLIEESTDKSSKEEATNKAEPQCPPEKKSKEVEDGKISKDDLNKGGEIKL